GIRLQCRQHDYNVGNAREEPMPSRRLLTLTLATTLGALAVDATPLRRRQDRIQPAARLLDAARTAIGMTPRAPLSSLRLKGTRWTSQTVSMDTRAGVLRVEDAENALELRI